LPRLRKSQITGLLNDAWRPVAQRPVEIAPAKSCPPQDSARNHRWIVAGLRLFLANVGKGLDFFKLAVPNLARVGVLFDPDDPTDGVRLPRLPVATRAIGVTIEGIEVRDRGNLDAVPAQVARANAQRLFVGAFPSFL